MLNFRPENNAKLALSNYMEPQSDVPYYNLYRICFVHVLSVNSQVNALTCLPIVKIDAPRISNQMHSWPNIQFVRGRMNSNNHQVV